MFDDKTLIGFTNLFSPHDFKKNDVIIKDNYRRKYCIITENLV